MKLDQYIIVNSFGIYAKRHDIKDLDVKKNEIFSRFFYYNVKIDC